MRELDTLREDSNGILQRSVHDPQDENDIAEAIRSLKERFCFFADQLIENPHSSIFVAVALGYEGTHKMISPEGQKSAAFTGSCGYQENVLLGLVAITEGILEANGN